MDGYVNPVILEVRGHDTHGQPFRFRTEEPMRFMDAAVLGLRRAGYDANWFTANFPPTFVIGKLGDFGYLDKRTGERMKVGSVHHVI